LEKGNIELCSKLNIESFKKAAGEINVVDILDGHIRLKWLSNCAKSFEIK